MPLPAGWSSDAVGGSDADWLRFSLAEPRTVIVTLADLSADARLRLFKGCGTLVATSDRRGARFEQVQRRLAAGTYRIVVDSVAPSPVQTAYDLRAQVLPEGVTVLSSRAWIEGSNLRIVGEVLNNTGRPRSHISLRFIFYDGSRNVIPPLDWRTQARRQWLGPRQRSMFVLDYEGVPAGYHHYRVVVESAPPATRQPADGLVVHRATLKTDESGTRNIGGTLENRGDSAVTQPRVMITLYDRWGRVLNADFANTRDSADGPLQAGASDPFEIGLWSHWSTADRVVLTANGHRFAPSSAGGLSARPR